MTTQEVLIVGLASGISAVFVHRWKVGVFGTILFGLFMEPIRKLVPGEPVYLSALVVLPLIATMLGAWKSGAQFSLRRIFGSGSPLLLPSVLFLLLVLIQSMNSLIRTGSLIIASIGLLAYLAPLGGVVLGYNFPRGTSDISRLFKVYITCTVVMATGVYLAKLGYSGVLLDPVGEGLFVYSTQKVRLESGFFRASEIAAWHMATAICLLFILAFTRRKSFLLPYLLTAVVPFLLGSLLFTGRRKALVVIVLFLTVYILFAALFKQGAGRTLSFLGILLVIAIGALSFTGLKEMGMVEEYYTRSGGLGGGMELERVETNWITNIGYVVAKNGILGRGAGVGSQGAQHFGAGGSMVGPSAEGGLGKIVAELGVPGLLLMLWLLIAGGRHFWATAKLGTRAGGRRPRYVYGLIGILLGNVFIFTIGHQVFGDPLVLIVLGLVVGLVLVVPSIPEGRVRRVEDVKTIPGAIEDRKARPEAGTSASQGANAPSRFS